MTETMNDTTAPTGYSFNLLCPGGRAYAKALRALREGGAMVEGQLTKGGATILTLCPADAYAAGPGTVHAVRFAFDGSTLARRMDGHERGAWVEIHAADVLAFLAFEINVADLHEHAAESLAAADFERRAFGSPD